MACCSRWGPARGKLHACEGRLVEGVGFRVLASGVQGFKFRLQGLGFGLQFQGFTVSTFRVGFGAGSQDAGSSEA